MPRKPRVPTYRLHRQSGRAIVTLTCRLTGKRRDVLLGEHGTHASHKLYDKVIADWIADGRVLDAEAAEKAAQTPGHETIAALLLDFWRAEKARYGVGRDTRLPSQLYHVRNAIRVCRAVCGREPVGVFGPRMLIAVRDNMIEQGWKRSSINAAVRIVVRAFRWGVKQERVEPTVITALACVGGLRRGEQGVEDGQRVTPIADSEVEKIKPHVAPQIWALVQLARFTGARMGELVQMRAIDIEAGGDVWLYRPPTHKTKHRDKDRVIPLGPRAQQVVRPFMTGNLNAPLFSPRDAVRARKAATATQGKPRRPDQAQNPKATGRRVRDAYDTSGVGKAIRRACEAAGIEPWHVHQLRHSRLTEVRKAAGLEAAQVVGGHTHAQTTEIYAERDLTLAIEVAKQTG
ncbi:MAG: tyrosine-type recombinase/integrase [Planctomycetota bacterium]